MRGCLIGVVLILGGITAGLVYMAPKMVQKSVEAEAFATDTFLVVAPEWDMGALTNLGSEEFRESFTPAVATDFRSYVLDTFGRFGSILEPFECDTISMGTNLSDGRYSTVNCTALAGFDKGNGRVEMAVRRTQGNWTVMGFAVNHSVLQTLADATPSQTQID